MARSASTAPFGATPPDTGGNEFRRTGTQWHGACALVGGFYFAQPAAKWLRKQTKSWTLR